MHPCPCCGYRTLPSRGDYELCPVCWWEDDDSVEPWEVSGPNGESVAEAQRRFLAERRPCAVRKHVRAPRRHEARDPGWAPYEWTDELRAKVAEGHRRWDADLEDLEPSPDELARADAELAAWNAD